MKKKKQTKKFDEDFPHGSICYECATSRGGKIPPGNCNTVSLDTCPYCMEKKGTFAVRDFDWKEYNVRHIWD